MHPTRIGILYSVRMELSAWVKLARTQKGLTQEQLAEQLDVTKGNVSAWENARHEPGWSQIIKLARLTGAPLPIPEDVQVPLPRQSSDLLADFYVLSPEDKTVVIYQIKRLADLTSKKVNEASAEKNGTISGNTAREYLTSDELRRSAGAITKRVSTSEKVIRGAGEHIGGTHVSRRGKRTGDPA